MIIDNILFNANNDESMLIYEYALFIFKLFEDTNVDQIEFCRE